jgi:hypothetical protein
LGVGAIHDVDDVAVVVNALMLDSTTRLELICPVN